jgi:hypothetical protein
LNAESQYWANIARLYEIMLRACHLFAQSTADGESIASGRRRFARFIDFQFIIHFSA